MKWLILSFTLQAEAETYSNELSQKKQELLELVEKISLFNSWAAEFDVMVDKQEEELRTPILADSIDAVEVEIEKFNISTREAMNQITLKVRALPFSTVAVPSFWRLLGT